MLTKQELSDWFINQTTKKIRAITYEKIQNLMESWANGAFPTEKESEFVRGRIKGMTEVFEEEEYEE